MTADARARLEGKRTAGVSVERRVRERANVGCSDRGLLDVREQLPPS